MSPDEAGFLSAITDNPADETARLAYADWLADRDDPRAAFARLSADFLRSVRGLADTRHALPPEWVEVMDPLFGKVQHFCLSQQSLGEGQEEAIVTAVEIELGLALAPGDTAISLETDKASIDVPAEQAGVVLSVLVQRDQRILAGTPLFTFLPLQLPQPAIPPYWQRPGAPPLVKRESMFAVINDLEQCSRGWSVDWAEDYLRRYFLAAEMVFGRDEIWAAFNQAWKELGLGWGSGTLLPYQIKALRGLGKSDEQIIQAIVAGHVRALRLLLAKHGQPVEFRQPPNLPGDSPPASDRPSS